MTQFLVQTAASYRIDEIYLHAMDRWGKEKAEAYISDMFKAFEKVGTHEVLSRPIPAEFGVDGFFFKYEFHFVYWKYLSNGAIGIVTILHERMHQIERFKDDFQ